MRCLGRGGKACLPLAHISSEISYIYIYIYKDTTQWGIVLAKEVGAVCTARERIYRDLSDHVHYIDTVGGRAPSCARSVPALSLYIYIARICSSVVTNSRPSPRALVIYPRVELQTIGSISPR